MYGARKAPYGDPMLRRTRSTPRGNRRAPAGPNSRQLCATIDAGASKSSLGHQRAGRDADRVKQRTALLSGPIFHIQPPRGTARIAAATPPDPPRAPARRRAPRRTADPVAIERARRWQQRSGDATAPVEATTAPLPSASARRPRARRGRRATPTRPRRRSQRRGRELRAETSFR